MYIQLAKARSLCACGGSVFMYDYQGFGNSQGRPTVQGACDDALAAYDYLRDLEKRDAKDIIAVGQSFGSGVTGQLALNRKLAGVIMLSGFSSLVSAGRNTLPWLKLYPASIFPPQIALDNGAVFGKLHLPLLIVHGTTDRIISYHEAQKLFAKASDPKKLLLLPEGHSSFGKGNQFAIAVKDFLRENSL